jgi:hypothetical protein
MLATIGVEFHYRFELNGTSWVIYKDTGLPVAILRMHENNGVTYEYSYVFGFAHENEFVTEYQRGDLDLSGVRYGVGVTLR